MMITTTDGIPGQQISRTLGMVQGNTIRTHHAGRDIMAELKKIVGGEITEYTKLLAESREQSLDRMRDGAKRLGANAIVGVRYGTAVIIQEEAA